MPSYTAEERAYVLKRVQSTQDLLKALEQTVMSGEPCLVILQKIATISGDMHGLLTEVMEAYTKVAIAEDGRGLPETEIIEEIHNIV